MRTGRRRRFLSGWARRRAGRWSSPRKFLASARISSRGCWIRRLRSGGWSRRRAVRRTRPGKWSRTRLAEKAAIGLLPSCRRVVFERFFDETGGMQLVVHAPFGGAVNRAWGLAMRKRFCRSFDFELQATADDDGFLLSLGPQHSFPLESLFSDGHVAERARAVRAGRACGSPCSRSAGAGTSRGPCLSCGEKGARKSPRRCSGSGRRTCFRPSFRG